MNYIKLYFNELYNLTNEMSPYLLLGFFFAGLLHVFIKKERIIKYLGKRNFKSVLYASLLGIPLPLCSCGVIPTGMSFNKDGASKGATVSFLISTPQTGVDSIMVTYSLLGLPFTLIRPIVALFTGIFGGLLTNSMDKTINIASVEETEKIVDNPKKENKISLMFRYAFVEFLQDISKWLIIGLLLAAVISVLIPDNFFEQYIGNDYLSMLIILLASVPLYVCATGSVPIVAVLLLKGLSPGAALVFLMAGPATNIATITVIGKVMGKKALFSYLFSIIFGAVAFGIILDNFFPREIFYQTITYSSHHHGFLPEWFKMASTIILSALLINGIIRKYIISNKKSNDMKTIIVKGMTCNHCKANVENNLIKISGISEALANTTTDEVFIKTDSEVDYNQVKSVIESIGYEYGGIKE